MFKDGNTIAILSDDVFVVRSGISINHWKYSALIDNSVIKRDSSKARMDVQSGQAFANRFSESKIFHAMFIKMVRSVRNG